MLDVSDHQLCPDWRKAGHSSVITTLSIECHSYKLYIHVQLVEREQDCMDALDNHLIPCQMVYKVVYNGYGFRMNSLKTKDDHIPRKLAPVALKKLPD